MNFNKIYFPRQIIILLILAVVLNLIRITMFNSTQFIYLLWNIFLATLPFIISSVLLWYFNNKKLTKAIFIIGGIIWLLLLPNAPYIVTDMMHLGRGRIVIPLYDTFLLFSSAWVGLLLGMYSLSQIEKIIRSKYTMIVTSFIIAGIILLTSFGMYLGRFLRFNSWDIFSNPSLFFENIFLIFSRPFDHVDAYLFTGLTFIFIYISYRAWKYSQIDMV